jgi:membrane-associated phospholipid phosphatase
MAARGSTSASMCGSETAMTVTSRLHSAPASAPKDGLALHQFLVLWRRAPARPPWTAAAVISAVILTVAVLAMLAATGIFADAGVARAAAALPPAAITFFAAVTKYGDSGYLLALSAGLVLVLMAVLKGRWRRRIALAAAILCARATYFFVVIALSGILAQLIKHLIGRARPTLMPQLGAFHFDLFSIRASLASFPSGHATTAFAAATALAFFVPVWALPLFAGATLIAASRIAIGAHYLSDVLAGSLLGIFCAILMARAFAHRTLVFESSGKRLAPRGRGLIIALIRRSGSRQR